MCLLAAFALSNNIWGELGRIQCACWWVCAAGTLGASRWGPRGAFPGTVMVPRCPYFLSIPVPSPPSPGTNYPMWVPFQSSDTNMRFRFVLQLEPHSGQSERGAAAQHPQRGTADS